MPTLRWWPYELRPSDCLFISRHAHPVVIEYLRVRVMVLLRNPRWRQSAVPPDCRCDDARSGAGHGTVPKFEAGEVIAPRDAFPARVDGVVPGCRGHDHDGSDQESGCIHAQCMGLEVRLESNRVKFRGGSYCVDSMSTSGSGGKSSTNSPT